MCGYPRQFPAEEMVMPEAATGGCAGGFAADGNSAGDNIARDWAHILPAARGISAVSSGTEIPGTEIPGTGVLLRWPPKLPDLRFWLLELELI
jgi:hypothetical protein